MECRSSTDSSSNRSSTGSLSSDDGQGGADHMSSEQVVQTIEENWQEAFPSVPNDSEKVQSKKKEMMRALLMISCGNLQMVNDKSEGKSMVNHNDLSSHVNRDAKSVKALPTIAYLSFGGRVRIQMDKGSLFPFKSDSFTRRISTHGISQGGNEVSGVRHALNGVDRGMDFPLKTGRGHLLVNVNANASTMLIGMENNGPGSVWARCSMA